MSPKNILQRLKNKIWHKPLSFVARAINFFPDKKISIIGVTGTDGKTTTATLIYQVLKNAGYKASLISTVEAKIDNQTLDTGLHTTSPDKFKTFKLIRQMVKSGSQFLVAEVTAHAIDQYRFSNIKFNVSVLTNTSHEHLDDFLNMKNYTKTKTKLLLRSTHAITNKDDQSYPYIKKLIPTIGTYSIKNPSQYQASKIRNGIKTLSFWADNTKFVTDSNYRYQIYNILAAYAVCKKLKINQEIFLKTIKKFPQIKGRREVINIDPNLRTIIDYAHTPQALDVTLKSLKKNTKNRLIVIFGATGGRDKAKRPAMGQAVSKYANIGIITADDTRDENVVDINKQIISGIPKKALFLKVNQTKNIDPKKFNYFNIPNRQNAFNLAAKIANKGDTIIACGKGHETTILHGKTDYAWSEAQAFRQAFKKI